MGLYKFALIFALFGVCNNCAAQNTLINITGSIADKEGNEIQNCYIKITNASTSLIIAYLNTGKASQFNIPLNINNADSIVLEISNISYAPYKKKIFISREQTLTNPIILLPKEQTLDSVILKAPPIWVRGDTTYFKADRFKEGNEKNLKDLILKLPGFEIDANDNLLYKRKKVEKVFIDGEDIFSDQVKLMINNFPLHVINTIQALENQNDNKVFKGLKNDNKVFLNIGLNKEKSLHAFGSGEIGFGTANRYLIKPIVFSLYRKLKIGYIGSLNSIGDGINWREDLELKTEESYEIVQWQISSQGLATLGNFKNNRYITNQRFSNNFQINLPSGKKFKNRILTNLLTDRQTQQSFFSSRIYNDSVYVNRNDTNRIINKPLIISLSQIMEYQKNDNSLFKSTLRFYKDISNDRNNAIYQQAMQTDYVNNKIKNDWLSVAAQVEYSKRVNANKGYKLTGLLNHNKYAQLAESQSASWASIFNLPNYYDRLIQLPNLENTNASLGYEFNVKKKNKLHQINLYGKWQQFDFNRYLYLNSSENISNDTLLINFKNKGLYNVFTVNSDYQYSKKFGGISFQFKPSVGYLKTIVKEDNNFHNSFDYPLYHISTLIKKSFTYKLKASLLNSIEQISPEKYRYSNFNLPATVNSFKKNLESTSPLKIFTSTANITTAGKFIKRIYSSTFSFSLNRSYRNSVMKNALINILQLAVDSFVNIPLNQFSIYNSSSFNKVNGTAYYSLGGGINFNKGLLNVNEQIIKSNITFAYYYLSARKNWNKKYFVEFNYKQFFTTIAYPSTVNISKNYNPSLRLEIMQRLFLFKKINFIVNTEYYNGNLKTKNKASLFFIDCEANMNLAKSKLQLSLKADNLTNKKFYFSNSSNLLSQTSYKLPIVKRNLYFSVKYNL